MGLKTEIVLIDDRRLFRKRSALMERVKLENIDIRVIRSLDEAMTWIQHEYVEEKQYELWLDYDLGYNERGEREDIRPFVEWLVFTRRELKQIKKIYVHSSMEKEAEGIVIFLSPYFPTKRVEPSSSLFRYDQTIKAVTTREVKRRKRKAKLMEILEKDFGSMERSFYNRSDWDDFLDRVAEKILKEV